jgi:hypothetical protein
MEDVCRGNDQNIWQTNRSKPRPELCRALGYSFSQRLYLKLQFGDASTGLV